MTDRYATLDRTTNGEGPASALTLAELQQLDAGSWFDSKYENERIPSLIESARECEGRIDLLLDSEGASSLNRAATTKIVPVTSSAADGKSTSTPNRHLAWPSGPDEFDVRNY